MSEGLIVLAAILLGLGLITSQNGNRQAGLYQCILGTAFALIGAVGMIRHI